jgi:non-canonical purine NTP pyrophosphatase (RdgB/HAM1 family)
MQLLIASTNPGKIREFAQMLASTGDFTFTDLSHHRQLPPVEETGRTFEENAALKAHAYALALKMWSLADDSGLEVDALAGQPGVFSARWAALHNAGAGDADNNALLLHQLANVPENRRCARFVCALALSDPQGNVVLTARDTVEGRIISAPRGVNGFGYDPLFLLDSLNKTNAELPPEQKHQISHRGKALKRLRDLIRDRNIFGS